MSSSNSRLQYLDIAKGIGIIAVLVGHTVQHGSFPFNVIFSFHMPLFFIVSGILFKKNDITSLIKKRYISLIVPYVVTVILLMPLYLLKNYIKYGNINFFGYIISSIWGAGFKMSVPSGIDPIGAIWFLLAMFGAQILYNLSPRDKTFKLFYCCLLAALGYFIGTKFWLPFDICVAMVALLYMFLGEMTREYKLVGGVFWVYMLLVLIWCIGWTKTLGMVSNTYPYYVFSFLTSYAGCLVVLRFSHWIVEINKVSYVTRYLSFMGRYSLAILCFHLIELSILPMKLIISSVVIRCILRVLVLSIIPVIIARIPVLNKAYHLENSNKL